MSAFADALVTPSTPPQPQSNSQPSSARQSPVPFTVSPGNSPLPGPADFFGGSGNNGASKPAIPAAKVGAGKSASAGNGVAKKPAAAKTAKKKVEESSDDSDSDSDSDDSDSDSGSDSDDSDEDDKKKKKPAGKKPLSKSK